ncbi:MAG: RNA 2',3'-cyclic phosphodiesterase [Planctomycetota bacterium]|nr:RNA 2',3'-cyclic phosphodiesterase [Planctomycetota bacterium]
MNALAAEAVRLFMAVDLGDEARAKLLPAVERLRRTDCNVRWVEPKNWHLTVKFCGDVPAAQVPEIAAALKRESAKIAAFAFGVRGLFPFPPGKAPRIVAAHIFDEARGLARINQTLETRMQVFGIRPERRGFKAHLTLGRVQGPQDRLWSALKKFEHEDFGASPATEVLLIRSVLLPQGAQYTVLEHAPLKSPV